MGTNGDMPAQQCCRRPGTFCHSHCSTTQSTIRHESSTYIDNYKFVIRFNRDYAGIGGGASGSDEKIRLRGGVV